MMKKKKEESALKTHPRTAPDDTILLRDLAPKQGISGGTGKLFFGERVAEKVGKTREK